MKLAIRFVLLGLGVLVSSTAQAGFTANFKDYNSDSNGAGIYTWQQGGPGNLYGVYQPGYVTTGTSGSGASKIYFFQTFCIQTSQHISKGNNYTYSVVDLATAPTGGSSSAMGTMAADKIKRMWATYKSTLGTDLQKNEAFQYAVWYLSGQSFTPSGDSTVQWYYNTYLDSTKWGTTRANLAGLANPDSQDQVFELQDGYGFTGGNIVPVPVPPAVVLVVAGVASGLFFRRRIMGRQAAVVA